MTDYYHRNLDNTTRDFVRQMTRIGSEAVWTSDDTKKAILFSMVPGSVALTAFATFSNDEEMNQWWKHATKPHWAPEDPHVYSIMDIATLAPLGYASYLVYKHGGGLEYSDTKLALGLYGIDVLFQLASIPLMRRRNYNCLFRNSLLLTVFGAASAYTFYKIDQTAGLLMLPHVLWNGFYTMLTYSMSQTNTSEASARSAL